jgi:hypothetical protein
MPHANFRGCNLEVQLTRAQRKVLADLELFSDDQRRAVISTRKLVATTGLDLKTVLAAINRLNELQLIRTYIPPRRKTAEHTLLFRGSVRTSGAGISAPAMSASTGGAR